MEKQILSDNVPLTPEEFIEKFSYLKGTATSCIKTLSLLYENMDYIKTECEDINEYLTKNWDQLTAVKKESISRRVIELFAVIKEFTNIRENLFQNPMLSESDSTIDKMIKDLLVKVSIE